MRLTLCILICLASSEVAWGQEPKLVHILKGHDAAVGFIAFSPDSKLLASSQDGCQVMLWDVNSGESLGVLSKGQKYYGALAFSPDGKLLAGGSSCRSVMFWDTTNLRRCFEIA